MTKRLALLGLAAVLTVSVAAVAAGNPDGANIHTSGSTNSQAYDIKVWANGKGASTVGSDPQVPFSIPAPLAARFFKDVRAARENPGQPAHCMKSVSFGTSTSVIWHDYTSVDLQCPPLTPQVSALNADVAEIKGLAHVGSSPHRMPMPQSPRMVPSSAPQQMNPTPSPEVSPT